MQNRGQAERPLRGLCGISACSPWDKKSQRAAVIPSGAPSAWLALLSDFMKIVNDSYTVMAIPFIPGHPIHSGRPAHPGRPIHPGHPIHSGRSAHPGRPIHPGCPAHFQLFFALRCACGYPLIYLPAWNHILSYGLGPSAIARMAFFK